MNRVEITNRVVNNYNSFVDTLLSQGFKPYSDDSSHKAVDNYYYNYGAVSFTERDGRLLSTYVSLHMNTVTDLPDMVFVIEYDVYTFSGRSRIICRPYANEKELNEAVDKLVNNINIIDLTVEYEDMEFVSFERVDRAIFKDKNGKLHSKYIMECELTHPGVVLEKPIEE